MKILVLFSNSKQVRKVTEIADFLVKKNEKSKKVSRANVFASPEMKCNLCNIVTKRLIVVLGGGRR